MRAQKEQRKLEDKLLGQEEAAFVKELADRPIAQIIKAIKEAAKKPNDTLPSVEASTWYLFCAHECPQSHAPYIERLQYVAL